PVPEPVREGRAVSGVLDDLARGAVHVLRHGSRTQGVDARALSAVDRRVDLAELVRGRTERDGPGHVGRVAPDAATGVDEHDVAGRELPVPGTAVGQRGGRSELDEPASLDAEPLELLLEDFGDGA